MKKFLTFLILNLLIINSSQADDREYLSDFKISGISVGESLLNFMSQNEIENSKLNYFKDTRQYYVIGKLDDTNIYDQLEIYLKSYDNNFTVKTVVGFIVDVKKKECLNKKDSTVKEVKSLFGNIISQDQIKKHEYDTSGKSKQHITQFTMRGGHVRIECMFWSKKIKRKEGWTDNLQIVSMSDEVEKWIETGYK
jgi:hypothetical protein